MAFEPSNNGLAVLMGLDTNKDIVCGLMSSFRNKMHLLLSMDFSLNYIWTKLTFRIPFQLKQKALPFPHVALYRAFHLGIHHFKYFEVVDSFALLFIGNHLLVLRQSYFTSHLLHSSIHKFDLIFQHRIFQIKRSKLSAQIFVHIF